VILSARNMAAVADAHVQMQMMYMQTYGMGMYGPNAINAQLYNNGSGYAAHQAFAGSKGQFNQAGAHKVSSLNFHETTYDDVRTL
jgi:hypothetical protein